MQYGCSISQLVYRAIGVNQHLRVAIYPLVELLICRRCLVDVDLVRYDKAGFGLAGNDHVPQISVIRFDIALPSTD